ncbi:trace amine-associated receptor 13c-like [Poeciliopsis prolifica]|uniref:trace amine-associated receptor 13c-like n=1 Tax=Poeciliopsis prolifica TaxID=188132 RepID=UPI0024142B6F|nr:trace amine-associated receptor 13c-like [Poeciliopsis prolifica]
MEADHKDLCFPQLRNKSCRKPTLPGTDGVLLSVVLALISATTATLNLLVIISVSHFRKLHTPTNVLLLSLSVSDFLVGLLLMPLELHRKVACWENALCSLYGFLIAHVVSASIGTIVLIAADRYVAVCDPLRYPTKITMGRVKCCVCLCWISNAVYRLVFLKDELFQPGGSKSCVGQCAYVAQPVAWLVELTLFFIVPVTVIVVLYGRVFAVAVSQARAMRSRVTTGSHHFSTVKKSELKAARTLGILVVVYLTCFCPYFCYSLAEVNVTSTSYASYLIFLFYFNSCLNPVIYALFYRWFRKAVKLIVTLQILQPGSREANIL